MQGIYEIVNVSNGVRYIGSSNNIESRLKQHLKMLSNNNHHSILLQRAWNKYGKDLFKLKPIAILEPSELISTEQRLLDLEHKGKTYNIAKDAVACMRGLKHSKEWKEKSLTWTIGNKSKTGITSPWKGKKLSDEHKQKLKDAKQNVSEETRKKMRESKLNDAIAMERIKQLSINNVGTKQSDEHVLKRVAKLIGRKMPNGALAKSWETRRANKILKESEES
jgi:group I intron endonuclease